MCWVHVCLIRRQAEQNERFEERGGKEFSGGGKGDVYFFFFDLDGQHKNKSSRETDGTRDKPFQRWSAVRRARISLRRRTIRSTPKLWCRHEARVLKDRICSFVGHRDIKGQDSSTKTKKDKRTNG